jgi:hypothetical protein
MKYLTPLPLNSFTAMLSCLIDRILNAFFCFLSEKIVKNLLARGLGRNVNSIYPEFRNAVDSSVVVVILNFYKPIK